MACPNKCKTPLNDTKPPQKDFKFENMVMEEFANVNEQIKKLSRYIVMKMETPAEKQARIANEPANVKNMEF
jgi:hypothetical protein